MLAATFSLSDEQAARVFESWAKARRWPHKDPEWIKPKKIPTSAAVDVETEGSTWAEIEKHMSTTELASYDKPAARLKKIVADEKAKRAKRT
jgi:hypothetical protein